jgi:hypothetical protein
MILWESKPVSEIATAELNRQSWDTISAHYQAGTRIATDNVHYGPPAPGEREVRLLGIYAANGSSFTRLIPTRRKPRS